MSRWRKTLAVFLACAMTVGCVGCGKAQKEPKPTPKKLATPTAGNANADGKGDGQSDAPLIIGTTKFSRQFNPFLATSEADKQVVDLTQVYLVTNDREGRIVYHGIDGELREYNDENYTYYGATDISVEYKKKTDTTVCRIKLRDDLVFSDGEKLTADDVIFTLYVLLDKSYTQKSLLRTMPIRGLKKYRKGKAKSISGIKKINDYELVIRTNGYSRQLTTALQIPICALHYYGDASLFQIKKNTFGFKKGDVSSILANKTNPMGAGAYRFIKCEDDTVYFYSNELYYLGCPETAYLQLKDMTETLKTTRTELKKEQETQTPQSTETAESPEATKNPLAEAVEVMEGTVDVLGGDFTLQQQEWLMQANSGNELSGDTLTTRFVGDGNYYYIGINANEVKVGGEADSNASKYLRKALATVLSDARGVLEETQGSAIRLTEAPVVAESWLAYDSEDEKYSVAYAKDVQGNTVYEADDKAGEERTVIVKKVALEYLRQAGYQVEDGKVVAAPKKASLSYTVLVVDGEENSLSPMLTAAAETLKELGITLRIETVRSQSALKKRLKKGTQQLWLGQQDAKDVNVYEKYSVKKNSFGIRDSVLNQTIERLQTLLSSEERKETYQRCFEHVMDWAVEVPIGELCTGVIYSTRIDTDTLPQDTTLYYSWTNEIQKVRIEKAAG